ncbi:ABC transporter substrate-binding protein [Microbacterium sp. MYb45]|uniref:ABC transporter substrate-binding protein n=1 Tax=Microbacterium sp. MYb45 TaxID=1827294 RepID=UPI000D00CA7F|nr:ABC transporter substrate-binding protein [Microbacterium sp. MYb45]PRB63501.1 zinc ABC transporter substrate-binding protein [Microbacterium sp. MYb45]
MTSRNRSARILVTALGGATLLGLTGCGTGVTAAAPTQSADTAVTIENCGRSVVVPEPPSAVVGLHPSQTESLLRLGLADRLVGQAQATVQALPDDVAALAEGIPVLGADTPPNRETLLAAEPDFVYSPTTYEFTAEQGFASLEQLEEAGVAAYVATGGCFDRRMEGTVDDLFGDLENLGAIFGVEQEAAALIEDAEADLAEVDAAVEEVDERLRVAQVYVDGTTLTAIGAGIEYDILRRAGAEAVFTPEDPAFADFFAAEITPEALAAAAPDALVFAATDPAHEAAARAYLTATFPDMPAVQEERLIAISTSDTFPGTLGNISVVHRIAQALYPDAFA